MTIISVSSQNLLERFTNLSWINQQVRIYYEILLNARQLEFRAGHNFDFAGQRHFSSFFTDVLMILGILRNYFV